VGTLFGEDSNAPKKPKLESSMFSTSTKKSDTFSSPKQTTNASSLFNKTDQNSQTKTSSNNLFGNLNNTHPTTSFFKVCISCYCTHFNFNIVEEK
jgi:hypothetical protein